MKRITKSLLMLFSLVSFAGCDNQKETFKYEGMIAPYLHYATFSDYEEDVDLEAFAGAYEPGACSSVRNGNFVGRNFDYFYNDNPTFVVKVNGNKNRYASIGIAQHWGLHEKELLNKEEGYLHKISLLPNLTLDGVNEKGVYINDNVVTIEHGHELTGTNPEADKDLHILNVPRYVLDNAASADEAVQLLSNVNIYGNLHNKCYLHYMIADAQKTYIVEFWDNEIRAVQKLGNEQVMTNFHHNLGFINDHPLGLERYDILKTNYDEGNSFEGMYLLMQKAKFTNLYRINEGYYLYSDSGLYDYSQISGLTPQQKEEYKQGMLNDSARYFGVISSERPANNPKDWITIHNSTYDIQNKKLRVSVGEDYIHYYEFNL